jgi:hypothetical protein
MKKIKGQSLRQKSKKAVACSGSNKTGPRAYGGSIKP